MGNHFHFVIQPGKDESLSAIMRWILSVFAMAFNRLKGYTGHVWGSRFFSRIIASLREFMQLFEYIDSNPVRASLVMDAREWKWGRLWRGRSGCRDLIEEPAVWLGPFIPDHRQFLQR
jgi:putative transposase